MATDWGAVYRRTYGDLVRFLYRKVWDAERARDLAQEVFVRALDHDPEDARAWLFTVATNLARDEARTALRRRRHLALVRTDAQAAPPAPDPAAELERAERAARVRAALERLTERDREVLLLRQAGAGYGDIARETGLAPGAVGTTLARARKRLVQAYREVESDHVARG